MTDVSPTINCPHCHSPIRVDFFADAPHVEQRPRKYETLIRDTDGQIADPTVRSVLAFARQMGPGEYASRALYSKYAQWRTENEASVLSSTNFGRCLRLCGIEPFRTSKYRGYRIPEGIETLEPVLPYINSRRAQRASYREAVQRHQGVDGALEETNPQPKPLAVPRAAPVFRDLSELPFEIEVRD